MFNTTQKSAGKAVKDQLVVSNISTCNIHDNFKMPHIRALEHCVTCDMGMCYTCTNSHVDDHHVIDWGFDIFKLMEPPHNELNEQFNAGHRCLFDWEDAKCPCGAKLKGKRSAAICSCCGTATCSDECHEVFL